MIDLLYVNIGGKIKTLAKWSFIIEAIGAIIAGIVMIFTDSTLILYGLLTLFFGPIVAWVSTWILYGFGDLVDKAGDITSLLYGLEETVEKNSSNENPSQPNNYSTQKTNSSVNCTSNDRSDETNSDVDKKRQWLKLEEEQGKNVGQCEMCGKKRMELLYVEFEDSFGTGRKNLCFDCFSKRNCKSAKK